MADHEHASHADEHGHSDGHGHDAHGGHDDGGHGHGSVPADAIPEGSPQDMLLTAIAMAAMCGLMVMMFWFFQEGGAPLVHHGGSAAEHGGPAHHEAAPGAHSEPSTAPEAHGH